MKRYNVYSQFGEDGIIESIFEIVPCNKYCVEFGAWDGVYLSNTCHLLENGWNGTLIEGNRKKFKQIKHDVTLINKMVNFKGANTLDNLLNAPIDFDLLSIDVDGNDYHIWESVQKYRPKVVVIEFNPSIPRDIYFVQPKDMKVNQGSSLLALIQLGGDKGYDLVATTECNAFFVDKAYSNLIEPDIVYIPPAPRIFQLYDGTLVVEEFKMLWRNKTVGRYDLQILPKRKRKF